MSIKQVATRAGHSVAGILTLLSAWAPIAFGHDGMSSASASREHDASKDQRSAGELVRLVRRATERFRDVRVAEAGGYVLAFGCVSAMGLHYVNLVSYCICSRRPTASAWTRSTRCMCGR